MSAHTLLKLTIFAAALFINGLMFAGVNYLFRAPPIPFAIASDGTAGPPHA
jgi:hypothetical protein